MTVHRDMILAAGNRMAGRLVATPTVHSPALSSRYGCRILLKLETLQVTGSFKARGALNRLMTLPRDRKESGVIAMSAGNHAQGVACFAAELGIAATIVMPRFTPFVKVAQTAGYGASVVLEGDTVAESYEHACKLANRDGLTFIHPYDDAEIIAGQGTVGLEILRDVDEKIDDVVIPIGGGGLASGIAVAFGGSSNLSAESGTAARLTGVQTSAFPSMYKALFDTPEPEREGIDPAMPATPLGGTTLAEGIAVKTPGVLTRAILKAHLDAIALVDEPLLERAVHDLCVHQKLVTEGAGAAGLAAVMAAPERYEGRTVVIVICGGNIDPRILSSILIRGLVKEGRLTRLRVRIEDSPGALAETSRLIGEAGANIVEVFHYRLGLDVPVKRLDVGFLIESRDRPHVADIMERLRAAGLHASVADDAG
ncbi:threonine ammonia-lyase [Fodinicurvata sp. EGI_FJ10296]|uniref:threonine ammonia-lyase n=1 Tax=Fodinicurvata sp. EGI_FJ10296 TaxID=3231908 RepID=UPI0034569D08